jgi:hypothetical protein
LKALGVPCAIRPADVHDQKNVTDDHGDDGKVHGDGLNGKQQAQEPFGHYPGRKTVLNLQDKPICVGGMNSNPDKARSAKERRNRLYMAAYPKAPNATRFERGAPIICIHWLTAFHSSIGTTPNEN